MCAIYSTKTLQIQFHIFSMNNPNKMIIPPFQYQFFNLRMVPKWPCLGSIFIPEQTTTDMGMTILLSLNSCSRWNWKGTHQKNLGRGIQKCTNQTKTRAITDHYRQTYHITYWQVENSLTTCYKFPIYFSDNTELGHTKQEQMKHFFT